MRIQIVILLIAVSAVASLEVVDSIDLNAYAGDWYEVASSPAVHLTFEKNAYCDQARYTLRDDGKITVLNRQRKGGPTGEVESIDAVAYSPNPSVPAKLKVDFGFTVGDYWVVALGPIVNGQYQYSVVAEPRNLFMWVLARDPVDYARTHEATVRPRVEQEFGFNKIWNKYTQRSFDGCLPLDQE